MPLGTIVLDGAYLRMDENKFKSSYFSNSKKCYGWVIAATKPKMRDYLVYTNKEEERTEWMDAITSVLKEREQPSVRRDLILAGGMGATKAPLPPPVEKEEEEDEEKAYIQFQDACHKHVTAGTMRHLRLRENMKKSRDKAAQPQGQEEEEQVMHTKERTNTRTRATTDTHTSKIDTHNTRQTWCNTDTRARHRHTHNTRVQHRHATHAQHTFICRVIY